MHLPLSVGESVSQSVGESFRFGESYRISELCELVFYQNDQGEIVILLTVTTRFIPGQQEPGTGDNLLCGASTTVRTTSKKKFSSPCKVLQSLFYSGANILESLGGCQNDLQLRNCYFLKSFLFISVDHFETCMGDIGSQNCSCFAFPIPSTLRIAQATLLFSQFGQLQTVFLQEVESCEEERGRKGGESSFACSSI